MKKKKQRKTLEAAAGAVTSAIDDSDLKSIIHSHSEFFDHLIELIPARFYRQNDDADSKPWYQGLSKAAKASLKQQSKLNLKLARRNRFDPDAVPSTALLQQQNRKNSAGENLAGLGEEEARPNPINDRDDNEKSVTFEELRAKLRSKIELLRGNRGEKNAQESKAKNTGNKRKRDGGNEGGNSEMVAQSDEDEDGVETIEYGKVRLEDDGVETIEYGKVRLEDEDEANHTKKKKKLPKAKELELAKKKQEAKKENPTVAERELWKTASSRAMGLKVHDNARLIKESMKREKKKKEKNAEKWKERVETQEKMKGDRQRKRKENIQGRINEKKMRKIAKREKKLMRPGFEGRKEGYITKE